GRKEELAAMLEQEGDRTFGTHVATELGKGMAHFSHGADAVVGHAVNDDGSAVDAVAFVADFFVIHAVERAGAALDRARDIVLRHVGVGDSVHGQVQARIGIRIAAAHADSYSYFLDQTGPDLAEHFILTTLSMLDVSPFTASYHAEFL